MQWRTIGTPLLLGVDTGRGDESSARIVALRGDGVLSPWYPVEHPYANAQVAILPLDGSIRMEMQVECGSGERFTIPDSGSPPLESHTRCLQTYLSINGVAVQGIGAERVRVALTAATTTADWRVEGMPTITGS